MIKYALYLVNLVVLLGTTGCAGAYGEFYQHVSAAKNTNKRSEPKTIVVHETPTADTLRKYGLNVLGYSSFIGSYNTNTTLDCATYQGVDVGADLVVVTAPKLIRSQTRLVPVYHTATVSTNSTTTTNGTFNGGWNGSYSYGTYNGSYSGNSNTQTTSTVDYYTNEYRTFDTYKFYALFLERESLMSPRASDSSESSRN